MELVARKRIEVLADSPLIPRIVSAFESAGVTGHTVLPALSGSGRRGDWSEEGLTGAESKQFVIAIAAEDRTQHVVDALAPLLDSHHLLLTIADVQVIRGNRF